MNSAAPTRIPANLITGFLGAGKTSALLSLLAHRPAHERWAVLVNEYGMVSLDHILLNAGEDDDDSDVQVDELAGGCFCCTLSMALPLALARLIRRARPHRIFLEPTGSGHPAAVIDMLRTGRLAELVELRTTICLVDPRDYLNPRITNQSVFQDQIQMADVVAINFTDKCDAQQIASCREFVLAQDPPKLLVAETTFGRLQPEWLDLHNLVVRPPRFADAHTHVHADAHAAGTAGDADPLGGGSGDLLQLPQLPGSGRPVRYENAGLGQTGCGWVFDPTDVFRRDELVDLLGRLQPVLRLKGVFHCQDDWWSVQRRGSDQRLERSAYRHDSRLEVIAEAGLLDWMSVQQQLLSCLATPAPHS